MTNNSFQAKSGPRVLKELDSSLEGLSTAQAKSRLEKFGFNEITEKKAIRPVFIFLKQFNSWLIYILLGAALFSFLTGHLFDVYIILAVLLVNGCMGFIQEFKAEKAILALKKMVVLFAKVLRNGELLKIPAKELVPGDIIILQEGDKVPADGRLLEVNNLRSAEAALTGESQPVSKQIDVLAENVPLAEQKNMVWTSTLIVAGQGKAIVTATGSQTALGQIANKLGKIEKPVTHFKIKTDILARQMAGIAILATGIIFSLGFLIRSLGFEQTFRFAVASLVSGIPEGLPIILVIVLAIGASRMAKRKAIVRNLQATENLGVANVIATDKTGTLTENTMNVERIILSNKEEFAVSGNGWQPEGRFTQADKIIFPLENEKLAKLLHISAVCNKARLLKEKTTEQKEVYKIIGDPTEGALVVLAEKAGLKKEMINQQEILLDDLPFSSALKLRASLVSLAGKEEKTKELYVVGAPEEVLAMTDKITAKEKDEFLSKAESIAKNGLRVLGLAYKDVPSSVEKITEKILPRLTFVGLVGMKDPVKPEVKSAIMKAKKAGIRVIIKTGDHKETALAVAKEIGLIDEKEKTKYPLALIEKDLLKLNEKDFAKTIRNVSVFARLTPQMKLRILETLQSQGNIVAMTGDGVNDALALKKADIGIAMGEIGTDVAKESSALVLADDNFASIISGIEEGRVVFDNIKHTSLFLISTNFAEHATLITSLLFGFYLWGQTNLIILPATILFLNLVTDGFAVAPLSCEPRHEDVLSYPPRKKQENILSKDMLPFLILMATLMVVLTIIIFRQFMLTSGLEKARAGAFAVMAFTQVFNVLNMRSLSRSIFKIGFFSNKLILGGLTASVVLTSGTLLLNKVAKKFGFTNLSLTELLIIVAVSSSVLWFGELYKWQKQRRGGGKNK